MKHICSICRHKHLALTMRAASVFTTVYIGSGRLEGLRTFAAIVSSIQSSPGYVESATAERKTRKQWRDLVYEHV